MQSTGSLLETSFTCRKIAATLRHTKGPRIAVATERGHVNPTRRTPCGSFPCALGIGMLAVRSDGGGELLKQTTLHNLLNQSRRCQRRLLRRHVLKWACSDARGPSRASRRKQLAIKRLSAPDL